VNDEGWRMTRNRRSPTSRESRGARAAAVLVIVGCLAALAYLNRDTITTARQPPAPALNPEFVACREARTGQVEKMRADGVINETQFAQFMARAIDTCAGQFPPTEVSPAAPR